MARSALLVIDVQKIYTEKDGALHCKDADRTVARINQLVDKFVKAKAPIIYVRHEHKKNGSDTGRLFDYGAEGEGEDEFNFVEGSSEVQYTPKLVIAKERYELVKNRYSAFKNTKLLALLTKLKVNRLVICGFMTNFCCESTAREALDLDFYVDFVIDATGTPGTDDSNEKKVRAMVGELLDAGFGRVFQTRDYLKTEG